MHVDERIAGCGEMASRTGARRGLLLVGTLLVCALGCDERARLAMEYARFYREKREKFWRELESRPPQGPGAVTGGQFFPDAEHLDRIANLGPAAYEAMKWLLQNEDRGRGRAILARLDKLGPRKQELYKLAMNLPNLDPYARGEARGLYVSRLSDRERVDFWMDDLVKTALSREEHYTYTGVCGWLKNQKAKDYGISLLLRQAHHKDKSVRIAVVSALIDLGDERTVPALVDIFLTDADEDVWWYAGAVSTLPGGLSELRQRMGSGKLGLESRLRIVFSYGSAGVYGYGDLINALEDPSIFVKVYAHETLKSGLGSRGVLEEALWFGFDAAKWWNWLTENHDRLLRLAEEGGALPDWEECQEPAGVQKDE